MPEIDPVRLERAAQAAHEKQRQRNLEWFARNPHEGWERQQECLAWDEMREDSREIARLHARDAIEGYLETD